MKNIIDRKITVQQRINAKSNTSDSHVNIFFYVTQTTRINLF